MFCRDKARHRHRNSTDSNTRYRTTRRNKPFLSRLQRQAALLVHCLSCTAWPHAVPTVCRHGMNRSARKGRCCSIGNKIWRKCENRKKGADASIGNAALFSPHSGLLLPRCRSRAAVANKARQAMQLFCVSGRPLPAREAVRAIRAEHSASGTFGLFFTTGRCRQTTPVPSSGPPCRLLALMLPGVAFELLLFCPGEGGFAWSFCLA